MFIRYFARTDETALGLVAAKYCDALVGTGIPVRLVSTRVAELQLDARGRYRGAWDRHRGLLVTPMDAAFVNVVCGEPGDWKRFYTAGAKNVLLLTDQNVWYGATQPELEDAVASYNHVYATSAQLATAAETISALRPIVVDLDGPHASDHMRMTLK